MRGLGSIIGVAGVCVMLAMGGPSARAATVKAKLISDASEITNFSLYVETAAGGHYHESGGAGRFHWDGSVAGGSNAPGFNQKFTTFCTDIKDFISYGSVFEYHLSSLDGAPIRGVGINEDLGGGMGTTRADLISALYGQHYAQVVDQASAAAFQLAIWEIVYEPSIPVDLNTYNVADFSSSGLKGFKAGGLSISLRDAANGFLHSLDLSGPKLSLAALTSGSDTHPPDAQDQIVIVPLPSAVNAGLVLLGSLLIGSRLRRNRLVEMI